LFLFEINMGLPISALRGLVLCKEVVIDVYALQASLHGRGVNFLRFRVELRHTEVLRAAASVERLAGAEAIRIEPRDKRHFAIFPQPRRIRQI